MITIRDRPFKAPSHPDPGRAGRRCRRLCGESGATPERWQASHLRGVGRLLWRMARKRKVGLFLTLVLVLAVAFLGTRGPGAPAPNPPGTFSFAALGDAPDHPWETLQYKVVLEALESHDLSWVVNVGDIFWRPRSRAIPIAKPTSPFSACSSERSRRLASRFCACTAITTSSLSTSRSSPHHGRQFGELHAGAGSGIAGRWMGQGGRDAGRGESVRRRVPAGPRLEVLVTPVGSTRRARDIGRLSARWMRA